MNNMSIKVTNSEAKFIDKCIEEGICSSREEFVLEAIRKKLNSHDKL